MCIYIHTRKYVEAMALSLAVQAHLSAGASGPYTTNLREERIWPCKASEGDTEKKWQ